MSEAIHERYHQLSSVHAEGSQQDEVMGSAAPLHQQPYRVHTCTRAPEQQVGTLLQQGMQEQQPSTWHVPRGHHTPLVPPQAPPTNTATRGDELQGVELFSAYQQGDLDLEMWAEECGCTHSVRRSDMRTVAATMVCVRRAHDCFDLLRVELALFVLILAGIVIMLSSDAGSWSLWLGIGLEGAGCVGMFCRAVLIIRRFFGGTLV